MRLRWLMLLAFWYGAQAGAQEPPLRAGVQEEAAPFVLKDAHGTLTGFSVELVRLVAARMQRSVEFHTAAQNLLFEGLEHGSYDLLPGPINATPDRAAEVLLTEGYLWSEYQFGSRAAEPVRSMQDLRGRRLAVRSGSPYADWSRRNAVRYGFTVVEAESGLAAIMAVLHHTADASLSGSPVQAYAVAHEHGYAAGLSLPETRTHASAAFRKSDVELRDEFEDALRCLKMNGTVARLSKIWFGREPDQEDLQNLVVPGYGVPGLAGYDPKPRKVHC